MPRRQFPKPCQDCGAITNGGNRCDEHQAAVDARRAARANDPEKKKAYGSAWRKAAKAAIAASPMCEHCGHTGSPENPLTGDHIVPRSVAGPEVPDIIRVLCRTCNSRLGARR